MKRADFGIDLHTAAVHRDNLPQIRADINDPILEPLARRSAHRCCCTRRHQPDRCAAQLPTSAYR